MEERRIHGKAWFVSGELEEPDWRARIRSGRRFGSVCVEQGDGQDLLDKRCCSTSTTPQVYHVKSTVCASPRRSLKKAGSLSFGCARTRVHRSQDAKVHLAAERILSAITLAVRDLACAVETTADP